MSLTRLCIFAAAWSLGLVSGWADALDTWTKETSGVGQNLYGITFGADRFVAVGQSGVMLVSSNGSAWSSTSSGTSSNLLGATQTNGIFLAVGVGGVILRSTNGFDWSSVASPTTNTLNGVGYGNGLFVAVGNSGALLTSPDGITWTSRVSGTTKNLMGVAWGNGLYMAVGKNNSSPAAAVTSEDGVTWVDRSYSNLGVGFYGVAHGAGTFVAMDARGIACRSATGTNWQQAYSTIHGDYVYALTYAQGKFVGVGGPYLSGGQIVTTSPNGITWQERPINVTNSAALKAVAYGNGRFVAVGEKGMVLRSGPIFTLQPPVVNGSEIALSLGGEKGRVYRIQACTNAATGWQDLFNITNTDEATSFTAPIAPGESQLYRALTQ